MTRSVAWHLKRMAQFFAALVTAIILGLAILFLIVSAPPERPLQQTGIVNDVTGLNPISVDRVCTPETVEEVMSLVKNCTTRISIGGARHSMGGHVATDSALHLDMRSFDDVL